MRMGADSKARCIAMEKHPSVLILCCNRLLRESVARIVSKRTDFQIIASAEPAFDSKREIADAKADVIILDSLQLLTEDTIFAPNDRHSRLIKCVLVAMENDQKQFLNAVRLGALGYVLQEASAVEVVNAIRAVAQGQAVCPSHYARVLFDCCASQSAPRPSSRTCAQFGLTRREQQLLPLIVTGMTNKEIANQLYLSEQTVKNHVHRILRKVGVGNRLSVMEAYQTEMRGL
jgi:two-component system response regulator DevR